MRKLLLAVIVAPSLLSAETWDLAKDFSTDKNPSGPWFYGYSTYGGRTLAPLPAAKDILAVPGLNGWAAEAGTFPFIAKNTTAAAVGAAGFSVPAGEVVLHPGLAAPADVVYVRWVAPADGIYQVNATLKRLDPVTSTTSFVIKQLGKPDQEILMPGRDVTPGADVEFSEPLLSMAAKDTLDFAVWAAHGPGNDATGLDVRIATADPELAKPRVLLDFPLETDAKDLAGQSREVIVHGNPVFAAVDGRNALVFDGTGDWVDTGTALPELKKEFTIEGWVRPDAQQSVNANIMGNHGGGATGMVLQQDGGNTNRFAFVMGNGAGAWTSTKPIQFAAERWQHVAIVKSPKDLKFFLNGVLLDSVPAAHAVVQGPMNFRLGLGFETEDRCFRGALSGMKIWNRALADINPQVTAEQRFEALVNNTSVRLDAREPSRIFKAANPPAIKVSFGAVDGPPISTTFECVARTGKSFPVPGLELNAENQFASTFKLDLPAGFYRLTCRPTLTGPNGVRDMSPATLAFSVLGDAAAAQPASRPAESPIGSQPTLVTTLDGDDWLIAIDPKNVGREQGWFNAPQPDAKKTKVPWIIQDVFSNYHGVAWYWRDFVAPSNPHAQGRYILRFVAVDYLAEVWVNGVRVGQHEGAEAPFEFDVTDSVKPGESNRLAVRVLNPTKEGNDGIALEATPHVCKTYPVTPGQIYNVGGIVDSVELLATPVLRVENIYAKPNWKTGGIDLEVNVRNASSKPVKSFVRFSVAPAQNGETLDTIILNPELSPGDSVVRAQLQVNQHRLWQLEDPFLYRVTATVAVEGSPSFDEKSTRCGFRDFRYENDAFRLNGKRIYIQGALILPHYPVGFRLPPDEGYLRRDLVAAKAMGLNTIRIIWGGLRARDLDLFDEMGILVQQEHYGATRMTPTPELGRRFDDSISGVIRRDRNHPSIVMWCLMNEMWDGPQFRHGVQSLPLVKFLDDTRLVLLASGGFDMQFSQGSLSNPGAVEWQYLMGSEAPGKPPAGNNWNADYVAMLNNQFDIKPDQHLYPSVPLTASGIRQLRDLGIRANGRKILLSETGNGCAVNLPQFARHYEQMGAEYADDARYYRVQLDAFMADWKKWDLGRIWTRPEDFFLNSELNMVKLRREAGNALRANPHLAGYTFCARPDSDFDGIGLLNNFREFKPAVVELQNDLTAPVRWCLFAEPMNIYSGSTVKLEAVLSNLDALSPGDYPVTVEVVAPDGSRIFEEKLTVNIPAPSATNEPPLVSPVFSKDVPIAGPTGAYKFLVYFERGAAATGGEIAFQVFNPADMQAVASEVVLWGKDDGLAEWLAANNIRTRPFSSATPDHRELILVGNVGGDLAAFRELAERMSTGSTVIFLSPSVFAQGDQPLGLLPLAKKGTWGSIEANGYFRGDTFAAKHPIFAGMPAGGIMDYTFYRNLISIGGWGITGAEMPDDLMVGGIRAQFGYSSNVQTAAYVFGAGRFVFNTLHIREQLGKDPVAEILLRNLLNYAAPTIEKPTVIDPAVFSAQLKTIGY